MFSYGNEFRRKLKRVIYPKQPPVEKVPIQKATTTAPSRSTMSPTPFKDISNVASCSKPPKATKSTKKFGVVAKARAAVNVSTIPFPISCDTPGAGSEFHSFVSADAHI